MTSSREQSLHHSVCILLIKLIIIRVICGEKHCPQIKEISEGIMPEIPSAPIRTALNQRTPVTERDVCRARRKAVEAVEFHLLYRGIILGTDQTDAFLDTALRIQKMNGEKKVLDSMERILIAFRKISCAGYPDPAVLHYIRVRQGQIRGRPLLRSRAARLQFNSLIQRHRSALVGKKTAPATGSQAYQPHRKPNPDSKKFSSDDRHVSVSLLMMQMTFHIHVRLMMGWDSGRGSLNRAQLMGKSGIGLFFIIIIN